MDKTLRWWHPGATGLATLWPISIPILPDEILSSWLVRVALANGCDPMVITGLLWPNWRCWTVDIDRGLSQEQSQRASIASGIRDSLINATSISSVTQDIRNTPNKQALSPWITTLGTRNRKRRTGLQYCPACLKSDLNPFFRLQWRFAWHTVCKRHQRLLLDRCTHCMAPVTAHLLDASDGLVTKCYRCRQDLQNNESVASSADALAFQHYADIVLKQKRFDFLGQKSNGSQSWFSLAGFMVGLVRRAALKNSLMIERFMGTMQSNVPEIPRIEHSIDFESMTTNTRHNILQGVWPLLGSTHNQFSNALFHSSMSRQALVPSGQPVPPLLQALVDELPDRSFSRQRAAPEPQKGPQPKRSVIAKMAALERRLLKRRS